MDETIEFNDETQKGNMTDDNCRLHSGANHQPTQQIFCHVYSCQYWQTATHINSVVTWTPIKVTYASIAPETCEWLAQTRKHVFYSDNYLLIVYMFLSQCAQVAILQGGKKTLPCSSFFSSKSGIKNIGMTYNVNKDLFSKISLNCRKTIL